MRLKVFLLYLAVLHFCAARKHHLEVRVSTPTPTFSFFRALHGVLQEKKCLFG